MKTNSSEYDLGKTSNLHPNTLFHLTNDIDRLINILIEGFKYSYALEESFLDDKKYYIPSICLSDLRLTELKRKNLPNYGPYGIGLSKQWGRYKGFNPVFYINNNSASEIPRCIKDTFNFLKDYQIEVPVIESSIPINTLGLPSHWEFEYFSCYFKKYEGLLERKSGVIEDFYFADEREWRKVASDLENPLRDDVYGKIRELFEGDYCEKIIHNRNIEKLERVKFEIEDVKYIIINDLKEKKYITGNKQLKERFFKKIKILESKMVTHQSIYEDF